MSLVENRSAEFAFETFEPVAAGRGKGKAKAKNPPAKTARKVRIDGPETKRRRLIDPTTCERDYSGDEVEFMRALDEYKRRNHRNFPTCSEILEVLKGLGYRKA